jgi:acyl dehydratase
MGTEGVKKTEWRKVMSYAIIRYFEDFEVGEEILTLGRTITETDIVNFCGFSGDFHPIHTDAEYAATQPFGARIAHGMCVLSVASGLMVRTNMWEGLIAFFGIENWRFLAPVMIGDTIHAVIRIVEKKETSKPDRGLMTLGISVLNQKGVLAMEGKFLSMMKRKQS